MCLAVGLGIENCRNWSADRFSAWPLEKHAHAMVSMPWCRAKRVVSKKKESYPSQARTANFRKSSVQSFPKLFFFVSLSSFDIGIASSTKTFCGTQAMTLSIFCSVAFLWIFVTMSEYAVLRVMQW